ncbi:MAG: haloalkane dehalogenase [Erythrobacter sp.]|uniref:haloalkane dehalogenase n=1 Tax=Erythrobacter sp. TaxID=1042 RepID=UPI0026238631|nr:haloalkane dehalogenase [Erythrobacter sp.]MDJ0978143.1 haloalkane dehalogenase [Erythrobacter sp.]
MPSDDVLRTPDERFEGLPDYPFAPNYLEITDPDLGALRQHYVDEGEGLTVVLLHGEPTWSFLYRKMIPILVAGGYRVLAPDLIGFGKSDKPTDPAIYSYSRNVTWLNSWFEAAGVTECRLFCQDWGGLLGLRIVAAEPDRFVKVCAGNTALPDGTGMPEGFFAWLNFSQSMTDIPVGQVANMGSARTLTDAEIAAYDAPFPSEEYKVASNLFPKLVPHNPTIPGAIDNRAAWRSLETFEKPFLTLFSDGDPVTYGKERMMIERIPGAAGLPHEILKGGGHFLQEDVGEDLARRLVAFFAD